MSGGTTNVEVAAVTRNLDKRPFVRLTMGIHSIVMELDEARSFALLILTAATSAETEAALVRVAEDLRLDVDPQVLVQKLIQERAKLGPTVN